MNFFKKNLVVLASIMSLVIIILSFVGIIDAKENEALYVKEVKGDRSVLNDVIISGYLQDKYHGQNFTINNGEISKEFKYYDKVSDIITSSLRPIGNVLNINGDQYYYDIEWDISQDANVKVTEKPSENNKNAVINENNAQSEGPLLIDEITYADTIAAHVDLGKRKGNNVNEIVRVNTGVKNKSDLKEFEFKKTYYKGENKSSSEQILSSGGKSNRLPVRTSNENNAYTYINGKLHFTVLSDKSASGSNGIFRVDEWGTWPNWEKQSQYGKTTEITTFSLDKHNIEVLGIENVNDKLILFMLIDDILTFRAYDPQTGNIIDELKAEDFRKDKINGDYQVFITDNVLSICFNDDINMLVSVKLGKILTLEHFIKGLDLENENNPMIFQNVTAINNKLFVFCYVTDKTENNISIEQLKTDHFMLFVYDKAKPFSKLLFESEIMTDADQDKEYDRQKNLNSYAYGIDNTRRFYDIQVTSK